MSDPFFSNVSLLLHCDGSFADSRQLQIAISALSGEVAFSSTEKKFGSAAADFRRTGSVLIPGGMDFGDGDFTVECWVNWNTASGSPQYGLFQLSTPSGYSTSQGSLAVFANTGDTYGFYAGGLVSTSKVIQTGRWVHLAITRQGGVIRFFVDGDKIHEAPNTFNFASASGVLGGYYNATYNADAWIDELRVTKGIARYTADFAPPTEAFPSPELDPVLGLHAARPLTIAGYVAPGPVTGASSAAPVTVGLRWAGSHRITGSTKNVANPDNLPVARLVRLHSQKSGDLVAQTWSAEGTGAYSFNHIIPGMYYVTGFDHIHQYNAVIADKLTAEPMP